MLSYSFACPLPNGMHARPASALQEAARPFAAVVLLTNERTGETGNAKSVLAIVGLDIRLDDPCRLTFEGVDERQAFDTLGRFLEDEFPHTDAALPVIEPGATGSVTLPVMLQQAHATVHPGTPVVPGIGVGRAVRIADFVIPPSIPLHDARDADAKVTQLDAAIGRLDAHYEQRLRRTRGGAEAAILKAHRAIASDPEFREALLTSIREHHATEGGALVEAESRFTTMLRASGSALLRERALDIRDVCGQLLHEVYGEAAGARAVTLTSDSVCMAESLTPGQFLALDRRYLKGLALAHGGTTSHTVILARSFGVPTLVGVADIGLAGADDEEVVVDAEIGVLVTSVTDPVRRYYAMERRRLEGRRDRLRRFESVPAETLDGRRIEVAANVGTAEEAVTAFGAGAEAVGLFRTEMLFLDRDEPPSEEEQFGEYRLALEAAGERPVIIRTLDVGGDKPIPYLRLPAEDNPFLGYRAVRLYPEFESIVRSQVRALVRASAFGRLKVMVPMVSRVEEARWFRALVAEEQDRCRQADVRFDASMPVGIMLEVPSAAFMIDHLSAAVDFFSVGTNDLLQYFTAVDRANPLIASVSNSLSPAFLRLLKMIVNGAHAHQRWVGLCGEMGGDRRALPLLVGLGFDEISMAAPAVVRTKAALSHLAATACADLLEEAMRCREPGEVETLVDRFAESQPAPLILADLVVVGASARTKEEAIKEAVDRLYITGRTDRPHAVEEAVWRREREKGSTDFGNGFAIPHCQTDALTANSLVVLKLDSPVEWGSTDANPVTTLIMLAIRESDRATMHMRVLSSLSRKLVYEEFQDELARQTDPQKLAALLRETLGL